MSARGFTRRLVGWWVGVMVVVILVGVAGVVPAQADIPPGYTPVGPGDIYLALGDSLTTGTESNENNDGEPGYPAIIEEALKAQYPDITMHLLGKDGESTSTMLESGGQLDQAVAYIAEQRAAGKQVGLVTLSIGGNDMLSILPAGVGGIGQGADGNVALQTFETNFAIILDRLLEALEDEQGTRQGDLILMDYYNPYPGQAIPPPDGEALTDIWVPQFNTVITQTATTTRNVPVANVYARFATAGEDEQLLFVNLGSVPPNFDYHPTLAGHEAIAKRFIAASSYFSQKTFLPLVQR